MSRTDPPPAGDGATTVTDVVAARTLLFVPGNRPERYAKAAASGADVIVVDLEDAVAPGEKDLARESALRWFADGHPGIVRVNAVGTPWHADDLDALAEVVDVLFLPKADSAGEVAGVASRLRPAGGVLALVETAAGVLSAPRVAALPGVCRLAFGNFDFAAQLGIHRDDHWALAPMRTAVVVASAAAGLPAPVDGVSGAIDDQEVIAADAAHSARLGFGGKLCIHPRQVGTVGDGFLPSEDDVAWAGRVLEVVADAGPGAATLDGAMIDRPVVDRARRIVEMSRRRP
ncbi:HpcH/HpaI aldolase/citrate lyase family protein [Janibacter sp. GS2]|uniref:HpcH/HpaI aldolase/citrate lyase family protein n=1 Tax=Janibacter sp. GS2 TaxID=3442646 RepID=UPI003EBF9C2B